MSTLWGAFGEIYIDDVKEGDLLKWHEWQIINKKLTKIINYGVYIRKSKEYYGAREIMYAYLVCAKTGDEIKILAVRLKKAETN